MNTRKFLRCPSRPRWHDGAGRLHGCGGSIPARCLPGACGLLLTLATGTVHAVGLGAVEVTSSLNQRLDARIPLTRLGDHPVDAVNVGLASSDQFREAGMERHPQLRQLQFGIEQSPSGDYVIRVRSERPIVEPFVRFLVEVELAGSRIIREYTMLLDPPESGSETRMVSDDEAGTGTAASAGTDSAGSSQASAGTGESTTRESPTTTNESVTDPTVADDGRFGPVRSGSSAWRVAEAVRPPGTSIYQTLIALYRANPGAFRNNDLGQLKAGVMIDIPSKDDVTAIGRERAVAAYRRHIAPDGSPAVDVKAVAETQAGPATEAGSGTETGEEVLVQEAEADSTPLVREVDAVAAAESETQFSQLREDLADLESMVARLPQQGDLDLVATEVRRQVEEPVASLQREVDRLRSELATAREQLQAVRSERERASSWAAFGGAPGLLGVLALLSVGGGALGGFVSARRIARREAMGEFTGASGTERSEVENHGAESGSDHAAPRAESAIPAERHEYPESGARMESGGGIVERTSPLGGQNIDAVDDAGTLREPDAIDEPAARPDDDPGMMAGGASSVGRPDAPGGQEPPAVSADADGDPDLPADDPALAGNEGEIRVAQAVIEEEDFALSLADVYLSSGWLEDAEAVLRDAIEQHGDHPLYRAGILKALYEGGHGDRFLEEFESYRALAGSDDSSRDAVQRMGKALWPEHPAFSGANDDGERSEYNFLFELVLEGSQVRPPDSAAPVESRGESQREDDAHPEAVAREYEDPDSDAYLLDVALDDDEPEDEPFGETASVPDAGGGSETDGEDGPYSSLLDSGQGEPDDDFTFDLTLDESGAAPSGSEQVHTGSAGEDGAPAERIDDGPGDPDSEMLEFDLALDESGLQPDEPAGAPDETGSMPDAEEDALDPDSSDDDLEMPNLDLPGDEDDPQADEREDDSTR